ncbi:stimulated by retinoic acid gene 6 protein-like isoform X2 [Biomphalaria glabrata]|nr:stimulated by retinoic acid gene 6 protein-like isoform X2 [Biomphalaria glabrata]XP_055873469.1 stimulated by retinoic acid gene 6 protein-like isoform X2 [Biomphalaria glabrata]XP_055873477.1 stimulated by retinoic acid gene 6 protein-like isoform X2 [Biomphalaria glabrata]
MAVLEPYFINYLMLIPATCIIILLSFLEKRKHRSDICCGRNALVIPIPTLDGFENRLAYAVAFAVTIDTFLRVVFFSYSLGFVASPWIKVLYSLLQALIISILFLPYFACINTRHRAVGAIINIIYSIVWFGINVVYCDEEFKIIDNYFASKDSFKVIAVFLDLPYFMCQLIFIFYCCYILYRCYKTKSFVNKHIPGAVKPHQVDHVRWVFRKSKDKLYQALLTESQTSFVDRMNSSKKLKLATNLPFFKYPTKIVSQTLFQLVVVYLISIGVIFTLFLENEITSTSQNTESTSPATTIETIIVAIIQAIQLIKSVSTDFGISKIIKASWSIALGVSILIAIFNIMMFLRNCRYHLLKLYQGDKSFISDWKYTSASYLASSSNCVGYSIIFTAWSFIVNFIVLFISLFIVIGVFHFCVLFDIIWVLIERIALLLSIPLFGLILGLIMILLSKMCFLQRKLEPTDKELPLNVDNRKVFEIISYFNLYFGMTTGLLGCIRRFLLSAAFGLFSLGRLDKSIYSRDLQKFDGAYGTYVAMLQVDNAHNNPSMRLFAHILWSGVLVSRIRASGGTEMEIAELIAALNRIEDVSAVSYIDLYAVGTIVDRKSKQSRTRWLLAYTLVNNPQLKANRKKCLPSRDIGNREANLPIVVANPHFEYSTLA